LFTGTNGGLTITLSGPHGGGVYDNQPITVENISVATNAVNTGSAIRITGGYSNATGSGALIRNVEIAPYRPTGGQQWTYGLRLSKLGNVVIENTRLVGDPNSLPDPGTFPSASNPQYGIWLDNPSGSTEALFKITNCEIYQWDAGVYISGSSAPEGVYLTDTDAVNCNWAVYWSTSTVEEDLKITGGHFNSYLGHVLANLCNRFYMSDMNCTFADGGTYGSREGVRLNYASHSVIHDNFFRAAASTTDTQVGVICSNSSFVKIHDNTFERFGTDIIYNATAVDCFNHHNLSLDSSGNSRAPIVTNNGSGTVQDEPYV
jgi:hypothetical protein